jgi:UDP-sugar transporter A1/2/3
LQNAFLTIIMHYSRITTSPNETYSAASAVLLNELLKGSVSVAMALRNIDRSMSAPSHPLSEKGPRHIAPRPSPASRWPTFLHLSRLRSLRQAVLSPDCYKLSIPAILYVIQNNLQYVAASNLDVATFQVTYQMKILTTAFFSVLLLRKRLSTSKWASLVLLAVGVAIVQLQTTSSSSVSSDSGVKVIKGTALRSEIPDVAEAATIVAHPRVMHPLKGFLAVTLACMTSGLAGVYFEFLLKVSPSASNHPPPDLWVRNTQLSLFSLVPAIVPILINPSGPEGVGWLGRVMMSFSNFNGWAIGTVLTQTFGGLITAIVIRYSDNIMSVRVHIDTMFFRLSFA